MMMILIMRLILSMVIMVILIIGGIVMFLDQILIPHSLDRHLFLKRSVALEQEELDV
jgi:hypothetical protein